jgi:hypothetical protein
VTMRGMAALLFLLSAVAAVAGGGVLVLALSLPSICDTGTCGGGPWGLVVLAVLCFAFAVGLFWGGCRALRQ